MIPAQKAAPRPREDRNELADPGALELVDEGGSTAAELARWAGITVGRVRHMLDGTLDPTDEQADALARALGVPAWLLYWQC